MSQSAREEQFSRGAVAPPRGLLRAGAVTSLAVAGLLMLVTALHPLWRAGTGPDGEIIAAGADPGWIFVPMFQIAMVCGMIAAIFAVTALTAGKTRAAWIGQRALYIAISVLTAATGLIVVDLIWLTPLAEQWLDAAGEGVRSSLASGAALRRFEHAMTGFSGLICGFAIAVFAITILRSANARARLGWVGVAGGLGVVVANMLGAQTGVVETALYAAALFNLALGVWMILAARALWQGAPELAQP